jgi:hypothetical protein
MDSGPKLLISPTKRRFSLRQKTCDIINAGSENRGVAFCYKKTTYQSG